MLGVEPFLVVNADIHTDYDFTKARSVLSRSAEALAHLVMIDNPPHHTQGDFCLSGGRIANDGTPRHTFSGIGVYHPELFAGIAAGTKKQLSAVLRPQIDAGRVTGEHHTGMWTDVGTPQRLAALDRSLRA